jgi:hypothetical protein
MSLTKSRRVRAHQKIITIQNLDYFLSHDELKVFKKDYEKLLGKSLYLQAKKQAKLRGFWAGSAV